MVRQLNQTHSLPPNPHWIEFTRSDGDSDRLPRDTTFNPDSQGHVNYMRPVTDDEPASIGWRIAFGKALASKLDMPDGPAYVLKSWPQGYGMFDHNKGPISKPRHDLYLMGSSHVKRFRSVPEFIPHAFWLITDATMNRGNCDCKYCSGTSQTAISEREGFRGTPSQSSIHDSSTPGPVVSTPRGTISRPRAVRQPKTVLKTALKKSRNYTVAEIEETVLPGRDDEYNFTGDTARYADLRATTSMSKSCLPRWHRLQEVVWCKIPIPIGPIQYWPALISNYKVKSAALSPTNNVAGSSKASWTISQWTVYELKMFGIKGLLNVRDKDILPYQMYSPPAELWTRVGPYVTAPEVINWDEVELFDPFTAHKDHLPLPDSRKVEGSDEEALMVAAIPFATAVSHAAIMATHWTPSHEITRVFTGVAASSTGAEKINNRGARLKKDLCVPQVQLDEQGRSMDVLPRPQGAAKRDEYQGLWFGPERIWVSDFVRLKCLRGECWPQGHELLLTPSGPSFKDPVDYDDPQLPNVGANQRGTFMFIRSLRRSEPHEVSGKFNLEVYGYLYEMAWADSAEMLDKEAYKKYDPPVSPGTEAEKPASPYRLPPAPKGFAWRPMLRPGYEVKVSSGLIAGRYYGRLQEHPLLSDIAPDATQAAFKQYISSMYGFSAGNHNSISVGVWNSYRSKAEDNAKISARQETEQYRQQQDGSTEIKYEEYLHEDIDHDMG